MTHKITMGNNLDFRVVFFEGAAHGDPCGDRTGNLSVINTTL